MGLRDNLKSKVKKAIGRFSGEYSEPAPETLQPYGRGTPDDNVEVVMARLNRPGQAPSNKK